VNYQQKQFRFMIFMGVKLVFKASFAPSFLPYLAL